MLDRSDEPTNTVTHLPSAEHQILAEQSAQQASRKQHCGSTELLTSTFHDALTRPERIL